VAALVQKGANINASTVRGETPLHLATTANQCAVVKTLLRAGGNVDAKDQVRFKAHGFATSHKAHT